MEGEKLGAVIWRREGVVLWKRGSRMKPGFYILSFQLCPLCFSSLIEWRQERKNEWELLSKTRPHPSDTKLNWHYFFHVLVQETSRATKPHHTRPSYSHRVLHHYTGKTASLRNHSFVHRVTDVKSSRHHVPATLWQPTFSAGLWFCW